MYSTLHPLQATKERASLDTVLLESLDATSATYVCIDGASSVELIEAGAGAFVDTNDGPTCGVVVVGGAREGGTDGKGGKPGGMIGTGCEDDGPVAVELGRDIGYGDSMVLLVASLAVLSDDEFALIDGCCCCGATLAPPEGTISVIVTTDKDFDSIGELG